MTKRVLMVGSFPNAHGPVMGGIRRTCQIIEQSEYADAFELVRLDSTQISFPPPSLPVRFFLAIRRFFRFLSLLLLKRPDLVVVFSANGASFFEKVAMCAFAGILNIPSLFFPRGSGKLFRNSRFNTITTKLTKIPTHIACQGNEVYDLFHDSYNVEAERLSKINNWSATELLINIGKARKPSSYETINLLYVGWLEKEKGINELLHCCKKIAATGIACKLNLVGDGSMRETVTRCASETGSRFSIEIHNWLESKELEAIYEKSDILLLFSWSEGMPNCMIEAMSCGVVPIVTSVGNIPSVLSHGTNGYLVEAKNQENIDATVLGVLRDIQLLADVFPRSVTSAEETFGTQKNIAQLIALSNDLIKQKSPREK